jgi:hypothetical protein
MNTKSKAPVIFIAYLTLTAVILTHLLKPCQRKGECSMDFLRRIKAVRY